MEQREGRVHRYKGYAQCAGTPPAASAATLPGASPASPMTAPAPTNMPFSREHQQNLCTVRPSAWPSDLGPALPPPRLLRRKHASATQRPPLRSSRPACRSSRLGKRMIADQVLERPRCQRQPLAHGLLVEQCGEGCVSHDAIPHSSLGMTYSPPVHTARGRPAAASQKRSPHLYWRAFADGRNFSDVCEGRRVRMDVVDCA